MGSVNCTLGKPKFDEPRCPLKSIPAPNDEAQLPNRQGLLPDKYLLERPNAIAEQRPNKMNDTLQQVQQAAGQMNRPSGLRGLGARHEVIEIPDDGDDDDDDDDVVAVRNPAEAHFIRPSLNHHELLAPLAANPLVNAQLAAVSVPDPNGNLDPVREANPPNPQPWEYFDLQKYLEGEPDIDGFFDNNDNEMRTLEMIHEDAHKSQAPANQPFQPTIAGSSRDQQIQQPAPKMETITQCVDMTLTVFPGICRDYVSELYDSVSPSSDHVIAHILDKMDKGIGYPKAKDLQKTLKRKRDIDEDEDAVRKYGAADRIVPANVGGIRPYM
jgi:TRIAD3 protein (E3 ubiquitin-protein ligase RNF216)